MSPPPRRDSAAATAAASQYDIDCRRCVRLAAFVDQVREANPGYFCRPVPPFGDGAARLVIVGLAPGMHGANASGRPFT
ncbi:MAG: uracil-DNA glycosylase, partial [Betaproteobacteria bacterium]